MDPSATGGTRTSPAAPVGWSGLSLVGLGTLLVLLAFTTLDWYGVGRGADSAPETTFPNLRASIDQFGGAKAATVYFDWLSWVLLGLVVIVGTVANVRSRWTDLARVLGFLLGAAGALGTYYALLQYSDAEADAGAPAHNPLYNASWGLMSVLLGYLLTAVGSVLGPRAGRSR